METETSKAINSAELPKGCELIALNFEWKAGAEVPEWIELLPAGQVITGRDGRTWTNQNPQLVVDAFTADGRDIVLDWEHATELKAPKGEEAPAAGWIKQLEIRDGAIWGKLDWTNRGGRSVSEREYRYLSPVFIYKKGSGQVLMLRSVALTNKPNLRSKALNHQQQTKEKQMELAQLLALLGLPEGTTAQQAMNHIQKMKGDLATALNHAETPDMNKFVPRGDYDLAMNRAQDAEQKLAARDQSELETAINHQVDAAVKAGKIAPASKDYYIASCRQEGGLDQFKKFIESAPVIAGGTDLQNKDLDKGGKALNAEEQKVADLFGNSAEDLSKYGKD